MSVTVTNCQFCGQSHGLRCPEVKAVEYSPDGTVRRVEYLTPADRFYPSEIPYPVSTQLPPLMPPWKLTCGDDLSTSRTGGGSQWYTS